MVTIEHSGAGKDPDRLLDLLWRRDRSEEPARDGRPGPGRRPKLTLDRVITAAIELADTEGLAGISMGAVARSLSVGTMTLYSYVPSKADLLDLMVDQVFAERALLAPGKPRPDGWREQLTLYAERTRAMYRRHPWLCQVSAIRPPAGPGTMAESEYILSALSRIGLTPQQMARAAVAISTFVTSTVSLEVQAEQLERATGQSNDEWWQDRERLWEEYFDVERFPTMTYVWEHGGYDSGAHEAAAAGHDFGLQRLLDGLEALIR
ncbi:MAG TPA: TetR/AcrR family transcriptional regulator [Actinopolymorphaceae bacterium]